MKKQRRRNNKKTKLTVLISLLLLCTLSVVYLLKLSPAAKGSVVKPEDENLLAASDEIQSEAAEFVNTSGKTVADYLNIDCIYSHRGSGEGADEHSLASYDAAIKAGSHHIEQDLVISKDGTLYVSHDMSAARITGVGKNYADMSDDEIDALSTSSGEKILKMSDVFEHYGDSVKYVIELRSDDDATMNAFKELIEANSDKRVVAQSFYPNVLERLESIYPDMPKVQIIDYWSDFDAALEEDYADEICVNLDRMSEANCKAVHEAGKRFSVWNLDNEADIREGIDMGADAFFTNDTPLAIKLEKKYGRVKVKTKAEPAGKSKTSGGATILFASDYQAAGGFNSPKENLQSSLAAATADGKKPSMAVLCGDYTNDANLHDYQLSGEDSIAEIRDVLKDGVPSIKDNRMLFVQGNHDALSESISESGLHEYDDCLVYVLNTENDFPWKQGQVAGCYDKVSAASGKMKDCFDKLIENGETRPVFIAGHVPLHFTARTSSYHTTGDNLYSSMIFDVVNEAAKSLDIVYLFGHNHSKGWDCYLGGACVFKAPGDELLIPSFSQGAVNTDKFTAEELNFTYMNAGYTGYYMNCGQDEDPGAYRAADETLTCTVCDIRPDSLEITRYDADGKHALGADGAADPYKGGIDKGLIGDNHYSKKTESSVRIERKNAGGAGAKKEKDAA